MYSSSNPDNAGERMFSDYLLQTVDICLSAPSNEIKLRWSVCIVSAFHLKSRRNNLTTTRVKISCSAHADFNNQACRLAHQCGSLMCLEISRALKAQNKMQCSRFIAGFSVFHRIC